MYANVLRGFNRKSAGIHDDFSDPVADFGLFVHAASQKGLLPCPEAFIMHTVGTKEHLNTMLWPRDVIVDGEGRQQLALLRRLAVTVWGVPAYGQTDAVKDLADVTSDRQPYIPKCPCKRCCGEIGGKKVTRCPHCYHDQSKKS